MNLRAMWKHNPERAEEVAHEGWVRDNAAEMADLYEKIRDMQRNYEKVTRGCDLSNNTILEYGKSEFDLATRKAKIKATTDSTVAGVAAAANLIRVEADQ